MKDLTTREALILAILRDGEKYGRELRSEYEGKAGRKMPLGSLYTTLARMEEKGLVRSRVGEATTRRGGNRRSYYQVSAIGQRALKAHVETNSVLLKLVRTSV
jgi:DNA-binding PadR family transcriptional regulator